MAFKNVDTYCVAPITTKKRQISIDLGIGSISYIEHIACSAIYSASSWQKEVSQLAQLSQLSIVQFFLVFFHGSNAIPYAIPMPFRMPRWQE